MACIHIGAGAAYGGSAPDAGKPRQPRNPVGAAAMIRDHSLDRRKLEFPARLTAVGWVRRRSFAA